MMDSVMSYICEQISQNKIEKGRAKQLLQELTEKESKKGTQDIAIIGMAGKFPDCDDIQEYWEHLLQGKDCIRSIPRQRMDDLKDFYGKGDGADEDSFCKAGYMKAIDKFDAEFFHITPAEAMTMDPVQRIALTVAWKAAEDGGYGKTNLENSDTGVFIGRDYSDESVYKHLNPEKDSLKVTGSWSGIMASRISYILNLKGPAVVYDSACSSGLVAIHHACNSIRNHECSMALAGGVHILNAVTKDSSLERVTSVRDTLSAFDQEADGTVWGEGAAILLLKEWKQAQKDGDRIYGVIKGSAVNNDGASSSLTAPNAQAQEEVLVKAWNNAGIDPVTLDYIEAHGTGTKLGDPIEITAIQNAMRRFTDRKQFCAIGSVKSNIGHTVGVSGVASIIKVLLSMKHQCMLPSIHFQVPNPYIPFTASPIFVNDQLRPWKSGQQKRRAGVTSFGFNGTNCHIVLEEAPSEEKSRVEMQKKKYLFTLSAKSEQALWNLVSCYVKDGVVLRNTLPDLCYSACRKRDHYTHRLAVMVEEKEELNGILRKMLQIRNFSFAEGKVFYGIHKIISEQRSERKEGYLTEGEKRKLSQAVNAKLKEHRITEKELCDAYVHGAEIAWKYLFPKEERFHTVKLPAYPLEEKRFWNGRSKNRTNRFLAEQNVKITDSFDRILYEWNFDKDRDWIVNEHKVMGRNVLPGTALMEMVWYAARSFLKCDGIKLEQMYFLKPVSIETEAKTQVILYKSGEAYPFEVVSSTEEGQEWEKNVSGKVLLAEKTETGQLWKQKEQMKLLEKHVSTEQGNSCFELGAHWNCMQGIYTDGESYLVEIGLPEEFRMETAAYFAHPALLDCAVNAMIRNGKDGDYLPFGYESVSLYQRLPNHFYSLITPEGKNKENSEEVVSSKITLYGGDGELIGRIEHYMQKKVHLGQELFKNCWYEMCWKEVALSGKQQDSTGMLVIKACENPRTEEIVAELKKRIEPLFCALDETEVEEKLEQYEISHILFISQLEDMDHWHNEVLFSMFRILKKLLKQTGTKEFTLDILTNHASRVRKDDTILYPIQEAVIGLIKSVQVESPFLHCHCIDVDEETENNLIMEEILNTHDTLLCAYRKNKRYQKQLRRLKQEEMEQQQNIGIKENGVYLITGGTSGIGYEIAKKMGADCPCHVILLGRHAMPQERLAKLRRNSAEYRVLVADVSSRTQMKEALEQIYARYQKIDGVFHCAGVAGKGFLQNKTEQMFKQEICAKIQGTENLEELLKEELDFFILFSSWSSEICIPGQAGYLAASCFLNAFAEYRTLRRKRALTIEWPSWERIGMAVREQANQLKMVKTIPPEEGIQVLQKAVSYYGKSIIYGRLESEQNWDEKLVQIPFGIEESIMRPFRSVSTIPETAQKTVVLEGRADHAYSSTEWQIGKLYQQAIGMERVDIYDSAYEIGLDSISALKIVNLLHETCNQKISISDFFEHPSIYELSSFLEEKRKQAGGQESKIERTKMNHRSMRGGLSSIQERICFLQKYSPDMTAYNLTSTTVILQSLKQSVFMEAVSILVKENSVLRTVIEEHETMEQVILEQMELPVEWIDLSGEQDKEKHLELLLEQENDRVFDLGGALFHIAVMKMDEEKSILHMNFHHSIMDGWSIKLFADQLRKYYLALLTGENIVLKKHKLEYLDWAQNERDWEKTEEFRKMEQYWLTELAKPLPALNLPTDKVRPALQTYHGSYVPFTLGEKTTANIKEKAKQYGCTVNMLMLSLYFAFLSLLTGDQDIIVGTVITGRNQMELDDVMGVFINSLCIRISFQGLDSFAQLIKQVKEKSIRAYENARYQFDTLVAKVNPKRDLARSPIFTASFQYYDEIPVAREGVSLYELSLLCKETDGCIEGRMEYNTDLFWKETITNLVSYFKNVVNQFVQKDEVCLCEVSLLTSEEAKDLLKNVNPVPKENRQTGNIYSLFSEQVKLYGDKTAVVCRDTSYTYQELERKAGIIADALLCQGIKPDEFVGILMERSIDFVAAVLGVLKAGAAYLPIDRSFPQERIEYMVKDSQTKVVLVEKYNYEIQNIYGKISIIELETICADRCQEPMVQVRPEHAAYMIYTSGSTGKPKGIVIEQRALVNFVYAMQEYLPFHHEAVTLSLTTFSFDIFFLETILPVLTGGKVIIAAEEEQGNPYLISNLILENRVDILQATPTRMQLIMNGDTKCLKYLKYILIGGESFQEDLLRQVRKETEARILNMYGPTETTIWSCVKDLTNATDIKIGKPVRNTSVYILNRYNHLLPKGVTGEICIGGDGVARGYHNRSELEEKNFIPNPFSSGSREEKIYKTGDLGKWDEQGELICLGRMDHQIKLNGYRIELGEIDNTLLKNSKIKNCSTIVAGQEVKDHHLVSFYVAESPIRESELRAWMHRFLPAYMVPASYQYVQELPVTPNGKIDKGALKTICEKRQDRENDQEEFESENARKLLEIWKELLPGRNIGLYDSFFDLGGNSLLISRLQKRIEERFGIVTDIVDLFQYATIDSQYEYLTERKKESGKTQAEEKRMESPSLDCAEKNILDLLNQTVQGKESVDNIIERINRMEV